MFELRRILASLRVIVWVLILFFCQEALLQSNLDKLAILPKLPSGPLKEASSMAHAISKSPENYSLILGHSSGIDGFSVATLRERTGTPWANFAVRGHSYEMVNCVASTLLNSNVRFETCLVALHPITLAAPATPGSGQRVRNGLDFVLETWAMSIQGWGYHGTLQTNPEREPSQMNGEGTVHGRRFQIQGWEDNGYFESDSYESARSDFGAVRELLKDLKGRTERLIIVKMPESQELRDLLPQRAKALFDSLGAEYEILDLHDFLEPDELIDAVHANAKGRARLSQRVAEHLTKKVD